MKIKIKKATIYLDSRLHEALKIKSVQSERSISDLISEAIRNSLFEDYNDLAVFKKRKEEPDLEFEKVLNELKTK